MQGAAKYLDDRNTSSRQSRVVLKYEATTQWKQLTMQHLGRGMMQYPEIFDQDIATDVVAGILYGAKAFMIFDKEVSRDESKKEVHGNMEVLVKALPSMSIEGKGSVDINEEQKKNAEKMQCKMYGDFRTEESPTNYEDAIRVYKRLPSYIGANGENAVAIKVYLCPLSEIDSKCQRMVREISANFINKTCAVQDHLQSIEAECNDLMREDVCSRFPRIKKQLSSFKKNISRYKIFLQGKLLPLLPRIRGCGAEESELGDFLKDQERCPFAQSLINTWIENKRNEMKRLQRMASFFGKTPFLSPDDVENEAFDLSCKHVVCCRFRIGKEEDAQILSMDKYLNGNDEPELNNNLSPIMDDKKMIKKMRETVKQFVELKTANEDNNTVKFLATEEIVSADFNGSFGSFIYLYEDGDLVNDNFMSSLKPEKLEVKNVRHDTVELWWSDPNFRKNNIARYKVQFKPNAEATSSEWITEHVACGDEMKQKATICGLQPATDYLLRLCAEGQIVFSQYSDETSATTLPTSPPGKPLSTATTGDTITIAFTKPSHVGNGVRIESTRLNGVMMSGWEKMRSLRKMSPLFVQ